MTSFFIGTMMKEISVEKFKDQCLSILEEIESGGVLITKNGRPMAKLIPAFADGTSLIGSFKGKIKIKGKIVETGVKWVAES